MPDTEALLDVRNVTKRYGDFTAVNDVSLQVQPGEIFALLGPNGAGKTTLINCITGMLQEYEGRIQVAGLDVRAEPRITRQVIGFVPQELNFDSFFNARQTLRYQGGFFGVRDAGTRADELLKDFALESKASSSTRWLSGGMKRRLMICKALMHKPALLFLDEPTAGVDVELREELWSYVRELRDNGVTILLTTHYLEEAEELADRIGIIHEGELVLVEERARLLESYGERWLRVHFADPIAEDMKPDLEADSIEPETDRALMLRFASRESDRSGRLTDAIDKLRDEARRLDSAVTDFESGRSSLEDIFRRILRERRSAASSGQGTDRNREQASPHVDPAIEKTARERTRRVAEHARKNRGGLGTWILLRRELHRIFSVIGQTLISPALTTFLWFLVFGYSLGDRLQTIRGIPYVDFLVPGLVMMALITNSFLNSSFGFFITKIHGSVTDLLVSPLNSLQVASAYVAAAALRGTVIGLIIWVVAAFMGASTLYSPGWTVLFIVLTTVGFASLGLVTGILAREFEHINFIPNFLLIPFTFLGGVFYSITLLPKPWDTISLINPIVYMVNGLRYGMTGVTDVPILVGLGMAVGTVIVGFGTAFWLLATGRKLRE